MKKEWQILMSFLWYVNRARAFSLKKFRDVYLFATIRNWLSLVYVKLEWSYKVRNKLVKSTIKKNRKEVRLGFAHKSYPINLSKEEFPSGGGLKYYYLNQAWPSNDYYCDILYVVSSSHTKYLHELLSHAKRRNIKIIWNQNGIHRPQDSASVKVLINKMNKNIQFADYIIYQSQFCKDSAELFLNIPEVPSRIIYNAVDINQFRPRHPAGLLDINRQLNIVMAGSHYTKGKFETAFRTVHLLRQSIDVKLITAGKIKEFLYGEIRDGLNKYKLHNKVVYLGPYTQEQAKYIYNLGHVYLHTKFMDPCPSVVIEAMGSGLPVVYSATGGTAELVGPSSGYGAPGSDNWDMDEEVKAEHLAEGILKICQSHRQMSTNARNRCVSKFNLDSWIREHKEIFNFIANK